MTGASSGAGIPKIEKVKSLNFHQSDVDQQEIAAHCSQGNEEPYDRLRRDEFSLFFLDWICHLDFIPLLDLTD